MTRRPCRWRRRGCSSICRELGLLDDLQVEEVVERALGRTSGLLEREELGMVVAEVLLDAAANGESGFTYWDLLRGDEGAIH